jgi:hypothetical protein
MSKKLILSMALALTLATGAVTAATLPAAAPVAAAQAIPAAAPAASLAMAQNAAAVQLTAAEMSAVQGAGLFSIFKKVFNFVTQIVLGVVKAILTRLLTSWVEQTFALSDGGETRERTDPVTENYNSQADYDAGVVSSSSSTQGSWVTTSSWTGIQDPYQQQEQTLN